MLSKTKKSLSEEKDYQVHEDKEQSICENEFSIKMNSREGIDFSNDDLPDNQDLASQKNDDESSEDDCDLSKTEPNSSGKSYLSRFSSNKNML